MNQAANIFLETHEAYLAMLTTQRPEWTPCSSVNGFTAVDQLYKRMLPPGHGQSFDDPPTSTSPLLCVVDGKASGDDAPLVTLSYASTAEQQEAFANTKVFAWESPLAAGGVRCMSLEDVARVLISPNLIAEMADRIGGITCGGIGAVQLLVQKLELDQAIDNRLRIFKLHNPYFESDHVLNIAYNILCNGECLEDIGMSSIKFA